MDCSTYVDRRTAHRCLGCRASIHAKPILTDNRKPQGYHDIPAPEPSPVRFLVEYVCDRTFEEIHVCGVSWP